jgi:hypothetical protein
LFAGLFYSVVISLAGLFHVEKPTSPSRPFGHRAFQRQRNAAGRKHPLHARLFHDIFGFTRGIGDGGVLVCSKFNTKKADIAAGFFIIHVFID